MLKPATLQWKSAYEQAPTTLRWFFLTEVLQARENYLSLMETELREVLLRDEGVCIKAILPIASPNLHANNFALFDLFIENAGRAFGSSRDERVVFG